MLVKNNGNESCKFLMVMENSHYVAFLGRVSLHVVGDIIRKSWIGGGEDVEVKIMNVITCFVGGICDGNCAWGEWIFREGEVEIHRPRLRLRGSAQVKGKLCWDGG